MSNCSITWQFVSAEPWKHYLFDYALKPAVKRGFFIWFYSHWTMVRRHSYTVKSNQRVQHEGFFVRVVKTLITLANFWCAEKAQTDFLVVDKRSQKEFALFRAQEVIAIVYCVFHNNIFHLVEFVLDFKFQSFFCVKLLNLILSVVFNFPRVLSQINSQFIGKVTAYCLRYYQVNYFLLLRSTVCGFLVSVL